MNTSATAFAWMNTAEGLWLTARQRDTHTGQHTDVGWAADVNKAYVATGLTSGISRQVDEKSLTRVPVILVETRTVVPV